MKLLLVFLALASAAPVVPARPNCPPKEWVMKMYSGGHWILNYTDSSWDPYMQWLGLQKSAWPTERNTSDIHELDMSDDGRWYVMNHSIPLSKFHLKFRTAVGTAEDPGEWTQTPYAMPTPAGFNPHALKFNFTLWRNYIEEPGHPFPDSCYALRTQSRGTYNNSGVLSEQVVDFTGELLSPYEWRYSLHVWDWNSKKTIEPWLSQMEHARPYPGVSYRYFKKASQSFADAEARNACRHMTVGGEAYEFC
jgi:hypothetical protein